MVRFPSVRAFKISAFVTSRSRNNLYQMRYRKTVLFILLNVDMDSKFQFKTDQIKPKNYLILLKVRQAPNPLPADHNIEQFVAKMVFADEYLKEMEQLKLP